MALRSAVTAAAPLLLIACHPVSSGMGISELEATLSDKVETVVDLSWESAGEGDSWVEFGITEDRLRSTPVIEAGATHHEAQLLGLPPSSTVFYEVFTDEGDVLRSQKGEIVTGGLPAGMPELDLIIHDRADMSPEPYMLVTLIGAESYVVVLDRDATVLWCLTVPQQVHRKLPTTVAFDQRSGGLVIGDFFMDYLSLATLDSPPESDAFYFDMAGNLTDQLNLGVAHHELVQLPDGTIATLGTDVREWYDEELGTDVRVMGDTLVLVAPDGERKEIFSTWDWAEPEVHERFYQMSELAGDWTHGNGLSYDVATDSFLFSLGLMNTVLQIDRDSGDVLREFGPGGWEVEDGRPFVFQHDPHWLDNGNLLMSSWVGNESRVMAIEYAVNEDKQALEQTWSFGENDGFTSIAGGQAIRMANGNTVLNTGYMGLLVEARPDNSPVWELASSMGHVFISLSFFDDFYGER